MNGSHTARQVLIPLSSNRKSSVDNHVPEVGLRGEPFYGFDKVLITIPIASDELPYERDGAERPLLVEVLENGCPLVGFAEFQAGKNTSGLEHAVGFPESGGDVTEVADAKGYGVEVYGGVGDGGGGGGGVEKCLFCFRKNGLEGAGAGEVFGVGLDEGESFLLGGGQTRRGGAGFADREHGAVDVGDGDADRRVGVDDVGVVEHAEGNVAGAAGDVEYVLRTGRGRAAGGQRGEAWVEGCDEVVLPNAMPAERHEIVHAVVRLGHASKDAGNSFALFGLGDGFIPKVGWSGRVGDGIFGGCWFC